MKKINKLKQFLFVLMAFTFLGVNQAWGATLTAHTAVASGSGKAQVDVLEGSSSKGSNSTTGSSLVSTSMTVSGGFFGMGKTEGYSKFTATASAGYYFVAWYTNSACTQGEQKSNPYSTSKTTDNRTDTYYAKFAPYTYTVTFDANGGGQDATTKTVTFAAAYGDLPVLSRRFYTFDGWFTAAEGGSQVTPATAVSTASNHTLFAHWTFTPEDQTLSWGEGMLFNMAKGSRQAIAVTASSGLEAFTYESNHEDIVKVNGEYLEAVGTGEATITVRQAGNEFFNAAELKGTFIVSSKETPNFAPNGFSVEETCELKVGQTISLSLANVSEGLDGDFTVVASTDDVIDFVREGNAITFTAAHAGETTITVAQAENDDIYGASATYSFKVTRYVPEFTLTATELELEQTAVLTLQNVDRPTIQFGTESIVSYDGSTGVITALKPGTTELTIKQTLTNSIEEKDTTFTISVSKKSHTLTVKINGTAQTSISLSQGSTTTVSFEKVSDAEVVVTNVSGAAVASYVNGLVTAAAVGKAEYLASLAETETYQGTSVKFTINVTNNSSHLPISGKSYTVGSGDTQDWTHKYETLHFDGIPDELSFNFAYIYQVEGNIGNPTLNYDNLSDLAKTFLGLAARNWSDERKGVGNTHMLYVDESADGNSWTTIWTDDDATNMNTRSLKAPIKLSKTTRYVRFHHSCNFSNSYTNISISELKYVNDPDQTSVNFGDHTLNADPITKTVSVNWCNVAPITVASGDPRIKVSPASFGNFEAYGTQAITLTYNPSDAGEEIDTDVTLTNGNSQYNKTIHVTAATIKYPQTITWNKDLSSTNFAMNVGEQFPDASIIAIATSTNQGRVTFTSEDESIIEVVADTALFAKGIGKVNITAHQAGDAQYQEVSSKELFNVTSQQKQAINWEQNLFGLLTTSAPVELTATATSGGEIKYESDNTNVVRIEGKMLIVVGAGEARITATQEGGLDEETGIEWIKVSQDNYVIVRDPSQNCNNLALTVNSLTLSGSTLQNEFPLEGIPARLTFSAKHGTKTSSTWGQPSYSELIVEEYAYNDNGILDWYPIFNKVVGTDSEEYSADRNLSESATKIRFRTLETGTDHTITNVRVSRPEFIRTAVKSIDENVESNTEWKQKISVEHSNIDVMTVYSTQGLLTLSANSLGEGCNDYSAEDLTISFTPKVKNKEFLDTVVITDRKLKENVVRIYVRIYSQGLKQSINFVEDLPTTALATDEIAVSATASSELEVSFLTSDDKIAYVEDGKLVILSSGEVKITAIQEGNEKYEAANPVERTVVISKVQSAITAVPTAAAITYGQTLSESALTNGAADVEGEFVWETPDTKPAAGTPTYNVIFQPTQDGIYATATTLVSLTVEKATPSIITAPTASDITIAQKVGDSELSNGEASVEGTFVWKNPNESRLKPGEYERTVVFTPTDENYKTVDIPVGFKVINVQAKIIEKPVAILDNAVYGLTLANVGLQGGEASVEGSFAWKDETIALQAGTHDYLVLFTPVDLELYATVDVPVSITVAKATPVPGALPTATALTYGQKLQDAQLNGGESNVQGAFQWVNGDTILAAGNYAEAIVFVPNDTANFNMVELVDSVAVIVNKAKLTITANDTTIEVGSPVPQFSATFEGFVNGDGVALVEEDLQFRTTYNESSPKGEYRIIPYGPSTDNYKIILRPGKLYVVNAIAHLTEVPTAKTDLIYTGQPQELINAGVADHGQLEYRLGENGEWSTEIPTATNAGDYTVYYQVQDGEDYTGIDPVAITATITFKAEEGKEPQTITWNDEFYTLKPGESFALWAEASSGEEVTFTSSDPTIAYIEDNIAVVAVKGGTVTITAHQAGNETYSMAQPISKELVVKDVATAVDNSAAAAQAKKLIRNNQVLIIREGRIYTATGLLVE